MSSAIGKRKPLSTLDDGGPPPNISIGEPTVSVCVCASVCVCVCVCVHLCVCVCVCV